VLIVWGAAYVMALPTRGPGHVFALLPCSDVFQLAVCGLHLPGLLSVSCLVFFGHVFSFVQCGSAGHGLS